MMPGLYILANAAWATVFFAGAAGLALAVAWPLAWKQRGMLVAASVCVAAGVGFSMMGQFWVDYARAEDRACRDELPADFRDDPRIDEICRAAMRGTNAISLPLSGRNTGVLDVVSGRIHDQGSPGRDGRPPREAVYEITAVYAVEADGQPASRFYLQLQGRPWRLIRVYRKEFKDNVLREVPLWDAAIGTPAVGPVD